MSEENEMPPEDILPIPPEDITSDENKLSAKSMLPDEQSETDNFKPKIKEDMEVHHHTHPSHGKKTWREYFWEFLMLFLAVFCGFLAEWQLEHVIEHSREKEYMESMVIDLHTDSVNLNKMSKSFAFINVEIDSLTPLLQDNQMLDNNAATIYQHQVYLNLYTKWTYSDRTIDQLKNSGNFRLIRNKAVSDGISEYDGFINNYITDMQNTLIYKQWQAINDAGTDIFKSIVFKEYFRDRDFTYHPITLPASPYFLTNDKIVLQKFINKLDQYAVFINWFTMNIEKAMLQNEKLDSLIRKEYHLE